MGGVKVLDIPLSLFNDSCSSAADSGRNRFAFPASGDLTITAGDFFIEEEEEEEEEEEVVVVVVVVEDDGGDEEATV